MANESEESLLDAEEYDITNTCERVMCCCTAKTTLQLETEEAVMESTTCFSHSTKRMPYGELGDVTHGTECGCLHSFSSNLSPTVEGRKAAISPGCGCERDLVEEIVAELKKRMKGRGNTGNIRRAEQALELMQKLRARSAQGGAKLDAILGQMRVPVPQEMESRSRPAPNIVAFEHEDYDMTSCCLRAFTCCIGHELLLLEPEEVVLESTTCCSANKQRRPYGELGDVQTTKLCGVCVAVSSNLGILSPGFGCERDLVEEVAKELKQRMKARGDTGNIQRQEDTLHLVHEVLKRVEHQDLKINALLQQMQIPVPTPPTQQTMPK